MSRAIFIFIFIGHFQFLNSQSNLNNSQKSKPMEALMIVKAEIIRLLKQVDNKEWQTFHVTIEAPPFTNKGFNATPTFLDKNGNRILLAWSTDQQCTEKVCNLIVQMNQKEIRNEIIFFTSRDDYDHASIFTSYSQNIEDAFQSRLPKSMRGKTIAWFKMKN